MKRNVFIGVWDSAQGGEGAPCPDPAWVGVGGGGYVLYNLLFGVLPGKSCPEGGKGRSCLEEGRGKGERGGDGFK